VWRMLNLVVGSCCVGIINPLGVIAGVSTSVEAG
jgi:hypothetical protein